MPFAALVGVLLIAFQNETRVYKFLSKLAFGSLVFGFLSMFFISLRMYLLSRFVHDVNFPFWFWIEKDSLMMALVFAFIAFLGGLAGIVFKGFYSLYGDKIKISKLLIGLFIFLLFLIISMLILSNPIKQAYIEREIVKAGYCEADSDCVVAANQCPFGCYITVNKNEVERIRGLVSSFNSTCVYSCVELKDVICENKKCRAVWETPDDIERKNAVAAARAYAAQEMQVSESEIDVIEINKKDWPDACLGLSSEDEICAAVITPGYEIIVEAKGERFAYRTDENGSQVRAE